MSTIRCPGAPRLMRKRSRESSSSISGRPRRYNIETRGCRLISRRSLDTADVLAKGVTV